MQRLLAIAAATLFALPASAQSSLGIQGATLSLGAAQDEAGDAQPHASAMLDVAITSVHGLQGELAFEDTANGVIGHMGAHLYMAPRPGQKYGLFATLSDVDGRSMAWGTLGIEGMLSLGDETVLQGRTGLGVSDVDGLDFIFAGVAVAHAFSPSFEVEAFADIAEFDEAAFRAMSIDLGVSAEYSPEGAPWSIYASLTQSDLSGRDGAPSETRLGLGVSMTFGQSGGTDPATRPFRTSDPVAPLVRRGLW